jgi:hypothetical protein
MDLLTFVVKMTEALAWPLVGIALLICLRPYLAGLVVRLEELTLPGGAKAKFSKELEQAREQTEKLAAAEGRSAALATAEPVAEEEKFLQLASMFPEAAIMQSYQELEALLNEAGRKLDISARSESERARRTVEILQEAGALTPEWVDIYRRVRNLRNEAVHHRAIVRPTAGEALEYKALCRFLADGIATAIETYRAHRR